jgi:hypothetical protein
MKSKQSKTGSAVAVGWSALLACIGEPFFMAWMLAMIGMGLNYYWWMTERHQWQEAVTKYQQELQLLKAPSQSPQSTSSGGAAALPPATTTLPEK